MEGTTAKLRKTFKYSTDEDYDGLPEAMDEEGLFIILSLVIILFTMLH